MQIASDRLDAVPFEAPEAPSSIRRAVRAIARVPNRLASIPTRWTVAIVVVLGLFALAGAGYGVVQVQTAMQLAAYRQDYVGHDVRVLASKRGAMAKVLDADIQNGEIALKLQAGDVVAWLPASACQLPGR